MNENKKVDTKIVGILNITPNSFSDGGAYFKLNEGINRYHALLEQGTHLIDIGAQSTNYGSTQIAPELEWNMLEPLIKSIDRKDLVSIDTYNYQTAKNCLLNGINIINDVSGGKDHRMLDLIAENKEAQYICAFSLVLPADKNVRIKDIKEVDTWFSDTIKRIQKAGIGLDRLILDPGIGFATDPALSFQVIQQIENYKKYGVRIQVGHSRKSFLESITNLPPKERDIETLAASIYMFGKVDYLRVHNVEMHIRAKKVWDNLSS